MQSLQYFCKFGLYHDTPPVRDTEDIESCAVSCHKVAVMQHVPLGSIWGRAACEHATQSCAVNLCECFLAGLSVAQVVEVKGRSVILGGADIVDGSPILDVKPYLPFCDGLSHATAPHWVSVCHLLYRLSP